MSYPFAPIEPPYWDDRPVAIVGAGPSLKGFDFKRLQGDWHVLAIKQKYLDLPFADAVFGLDLPWIRNYGAQVVASGIPTYFSLPDTPFDELPERLRVPLVPGANYLRRQRSGDLFSTDHDTINHCGNSGFGGHNLAILKRAKHIVLFGFDYSTDGHDKPEQYPWSPPGHNARYWPRWAESYGKVAPQLKSLGVITVNASINSKMIAFPKVNLDDGINLLHGGDFRRFAV